MCYSVFGCGGLLIGRLCGYLVHWSVRIGCVCTGVISDFILSSSDSLLLCVRWCGDGFRSSHFVCVV